MVMAVPYDDPEEIRNLLSLVSNAVIMQEDDWIVQIAVDVDVWKGILKIFPRPDSIYG